MALALFPTLSQYRQCLANQSESRDRLNPTDSYNVVEFISRYKITRIIEKIVGYSLRPKNWSLHPIPSTTLQFLSIGSFQTVIATSHGVSQSSVKVYWSSK